MKNILFIIATTIAMTSLFAQREVTMYAMENVYQATYVNPAIIPQSQVSVGLPAISSVYAGAAIPISARDIIDDNVISPSKMIDDLNKGLWNMTFTNVDILHARVKARNWFFSFSARARAYSKLMVDKDLLELAWYGNGPKLGQNISLNEMGNDQTSYTELGIGASKEFGKWTFGAKLKANFGIANTSNKKNESSLYFDPTTYEAQLNGSYIINTGSLPNIDSGGIEPADYLKLNTKNFGLGIDMGASYELNDKIELSASLVDFGFIKWNDNPQNYELKVEGVVQGADAIGAILRGEDSDSVWNAWLDGLEDQADYINTQNSYSTMLHGQLYLNGQYKLTEATKVYGTMNMMMWKGVRTSLTAGIYHEIGRTLNITLNNTVQYNRLFNIGLGFMVKPGPVQFYFVADNIFAGNFVRYKNVGAPLPDYMTNANFRLGFNLVFGKVHGEDKVL